jgi:hypothetical protein
MQVQIKITATVHTAQFGTLVNGDVLRVNEEFAAHLVNECKAGEYMAAEAKPTRKAK